MKIRDILEWGFIGLTWAIIPGIAVYFGILYYPDYVPAITVGAAIYMIAYPWIWDAEVGKTWREKKEEIQ